MHSIRALPVPDLGFTHMRRCVLASVVVSLTLAGHASGSGDLPSAVGVLLAVVIAGGLTLTATSRKRSWPWLVSFLMAAQVLIHVVLVISAPHAHGASTLLPTGVTALGHLIASLIAAVVLARGEDVLLAWSRLLSSTFGWVLPPVLASAVGPTIVRDRNGWTPIASDRGWDAERRGPPRFDHA